MQWLDLGVVLATYAVILPAELPDKSFVATLVLATRFPRWLVLLGASAAFAVQAAVAVAAGGLIGLLPQQAVLTVAAVLFATGSVLLVRGGLRAREVELAEEADEEAQVRARAGTGGGRAVAFGTAFAVVFGAEWGDLTQLVTAGQAARTGLPGSVFLGAWLALTTVALLGVLAGGWLQRRVPLWRVRLISGGLLAALAVLSVVELVRS